MNAESLSWLCYLAAVSVWAIAVWGANSIKNLLIALAPYVLGAGLAVGIVGSFYAALYWLHCVFMR